MKRIILSISFVTICILSFAQQGKTTEAKEAKIVFEELSHNFGVQEKGSDVSYVFKFSNEGKIPLTLTGVKPSCGCTTPLWTKTPILPGKTGEIKISYDSKRIGSFSKSIVVNSNATNSPVTLKIKGEIKQ